MGNGFRRIKLKSSHAALGGLPLVLVVVLVVVLAALWLMSDDASQAAIEEVEALGHRALGTRVDIGDARLDRNAGELALSGVSVANPGGFSNRDMISVESVVLSGDLDGRLIESISLDGVRARIELRGARSNFETLSERIADAPDRDDAGEPAEARDGVEAGGAGSEGDAGGAGEPQDDWTVKRIEFGRAAVTVSADWTSKTIELETEGLSVGNLRGGASDVARAAVVTFLADLLEQAAGRAEDDRLREILLEKAAEVRARHPEGAGG